uniref:Cochlin n=1 Tax=Cyclopterus lumpus TaxID=8103 RepID=A0A8C2XGY0_CYCLU
PGLPGVPGAEMSQVLLLLTGELLLPFPVTCVTRGADLVEGGLLVSCPPDCPQWKVSVFGTEVYASVSSVCGAAVHRGILGRPGGSVRVHKLPGQQNYLRSYAHGIQSQALSRWTASFSLTSRLQPFWSSSQSVWTAESPTRGGTRLLPGCGQRSDCQMDIAMVIDSSNNIGQRRFNLQKNFVTKLASMLKVGSTGPHVGLLQASDSPRTEFLLTNYTQPKELLPAIKELVYLGGATNTGTHTHTTWGEPPTQVHTHTLPGGSKAIMHAVETFFTQENGGRRGHPRVMMVLIDGWPSDDLEQAAMLARESGINVFLVSVAKPAPEELAMVRDKDFMKKAVCKDNGFFSYPISSWFSTTKHVKPLAQKLCSLDLLLCSKTCYNSVNIGFLIDGSSSIGEGNFQLVLDFLTGIARSFDISDIGARIGAVQFTYDQRLEFGLFEHSNKEDSIDALKRIPYMSGGTATGAAISYTTQNLFSQQSYLMKKVPLTMSHELILKVWFRMTVF